MPSFTRTVANASVSGNSLVETSLISCPTFSGTLTQVAINLDVVLEVTQAKAEWMHPASSTTLRASGTTYYKLYRQLGGSPAPSTDPLILSVMCNTFRDRSVTPFDQVQDYQGSSGFTFGTFIDTNTGSIVLSSGTLFNSFKQSVEGSVNELYLLTDRIGGVYVKPPLYYPDNWIQAYPVKTQGEALITIQYS